MAANHPQGQPQDLGPWVRGLVAQKKGAGFGGQNTRSLGYFCETAQSFPSFWCDRVQIVVATSSSVLDRCVRPHGLTQIWPHLSLAIIVQRDNDPRRANVQPTTRSCTRNPLRDLEKCSFPEAHPDRKICPKPPIFRHQCMHKSVDEEPTLNPPSPNKRLLDDDERPDDHCARLRRIDHSGFDACPLAGDESVNDEHPLGR